MTRPESDRIQEYELKDIQVADTMYLAEQGDMYAQYSLGVRYNRGEGVEQDDEEAVKWFRLAAEQGHADAQRALAEF